MNNVFDIKRFGRYFAYDLNNARNNFGVSALTVGLLPLILLFFNTLFGLVFTGDVPQVVLPAKVVILVFAFIIVAISGPVKLYGHLTERRSGSDWLMIPASSFEKFLSMALMLCIVLPVAVLGLFSICDLLLSWIVPFYGDSVVCQLGSGLDNLITNSDVSVMFLSPGGTYASTWLNWCIGILPFALHLQGFHVFDTAVQTVSAIKSIISSIIPGYTPSQKLLFIMKSVCSRPPATR